MKLIRELIEETEILTEDINGKKEYFLHGPMLRSNVQNANKRSYPRHVLENEYKNYENNYIKKNRALGELGHPSNPTINLPLVSHMIVEGKQDGDTWTGKAKILNTPNGSIVKGFIDEGVLLGFSSRGVGSLKLNKATGVNEVQEDFKLFTMADIVANPSAPDCFATGLMESAEWIFENGHWKEVVLENAIKSLKKDGSTKNQLKIFEEFISNINFHK